MPQDVEFTVPLESRVSPDLPRARRHHLAWVRESGLLRDEEALRRYECLRVADSAAYGFPYAAGADLDLCFDLLGWLFLLDDHLDHHTDARPGARGDNHPAARPAARPRASAAARTEDAVALCQQLVDHLRYGTRPGAGAAPVVAAFADCWQRMSHGMSQEWRRRTAHDWVDYLAGWPTKIADRIPGALPDPAAHLRARRRTIGLRPLLALAERTGHYEVPLPAWCSSHLEGMRIAACDAIIAMNEVHALERDEASGRPNLVLSLMHHQGRARPEALREVGDTARRSVETFLQLHACLPQLERDLGGRVPELARYADAHAAWIRGYHDWGRTAPCYEDVRRPG
ncbi:pentalenene synthase [Kitasatospora sp. NPDC028055]|uniref:terpene synthase family protein n=1 Tax=Kitasatospora sp. NPDC028055 TaxID=3155653 RepID=UPI0033F994DF